MKRMSGYFDKNGLELGEGDEILFDDGYKQSKWILKYGVGSYETGIFPYLGWYFESPNSQYEDEDGDVFIVLGESDATGYMIFQTEKITKTS